MKRRALFLLLSLALLFSLVLPAATAYADDNSSGKGMEISKTAAYNEDGSYTITLEAYATGAKVISDISKDIPTDIILVLDQSGSMDDDIGKIAFELYKDAQYYGGIDYHTRNQDYYEYRHNGGSENLWHKLTDGSYVSVSVTKKTTYRQLGSLVNYESSWGSITQNCYWYYVNNLYEKVGDEYKKVTLTYAYSYDERAYVFTYTFSDGSSITSVGRDTSPDLGNHSPLYTPVADGNDTIYTYTYTDADGVVQTIGTSTGADTVFSPTLYKRTTVASGTKRIDAIKTAATTFVNEVAAKAAGADGNITTTDDNINHRIAVVGFASKSGYGNNTELLSIGGRNSGSVGVAYNSITNQNYKDVVQNMDTSAGQTMVTNAINALAANGATRIDLGMNMAKNILNANPVPTGEQRNRVVIVFTDGSPTESNGFQKNVADSAITTSNDIKALGATVYSIGVFSGADAKSAGTEPSGNLNEGDSQMTAACNWFMQKVSSNNGTPQSPSYYLSASDAASLNSIFKQISDQIESGGTSSTLTDQSVVKDIITPYFELSEGTTAEDIKIETFACTGKDAGGEYTWSNNNRTMGATASINGDRVDVTGFNFSENYVGTVSQNGNITYRGHKLVISFKVFPKAGFLGGNDVDTNTNAGIYENKDATSPVLTFEKPKVNVPIKGITVTAQDKNIYLLGDVTADQLKNGATVMVGNVSLDLSKPNFGLEAWQNEFVDIRVDIVDADDVSVSGLTDLKDDTTYKIKVTVSPKTSDPKSTIGPKAVAQPGDDSANINVFKPEVTFKDTVIDYGETANYKDNGGAAIWKHGNVQDTDVEMNGTAKPTLDFNYDPAAGAFTGDTPVKVTVDLVNADNTKYSGINADVTFHHDECDYEGCTWSDTTDAHFIVHVRQIHITVIKNVEGNFGDKNKQFTITVYSDGTLVAAENNGGNTFTDGTRKTYLVPANKSITIAETADNYTMTVTVGTKSYTVVENRTCTIDANELKNGDVITVTNTRNTTPDMGVSLDSLPYIIVLAAVAVAAVVIILRKRRNNDD